MPTYNGTDGYKNADMVKYINRDLRYTYTYRVGKLYSRSIVAKSEHLEKGSNSFSYVPYLTTICSDT